VSYKYPSPGSPMFWLSLCCSFFLAYYVVLLCVSASLSSVLWCPLRFTQKNPMFDSCLPPVVCRSTHVLLCFCVCLRTVVSNILSYQMALRSEFRVAMYVRYDFRIKRCSVRLYLQLFVGGFMSFLRYLCLFAYSGVQHILCCVLFFFYVSSSCVLCTQCNQLLWIVHSWLSILDCPFLIAHSWLSIRFSPTFIYSNALSLEHCSW
jgi:hypothetical protein